jgi:hypothetical protein
MSLDYILSNGATIGFSSEAERDAYLDTTAGTGAQTQEFALAANPGESMETIKNIYHDRHYGPGGAFEQQLLSGAADPTQARAYFDAGGQDPAVIQKILSAAQTWGAQTDQNFGYNRGIDDDVNPGLNQALSMIYGYGGDYGQGGWVEHAGQMNAEDRASADRFLRLVDDADVGAGGAGGAGGGGAGGDDDLRFYGGGGAGGIGSLSRSGGYIIDANANPAMGGHIFAARPGVSSSPGVTPMRPMRWGRVAADQYLSRARDQGMATYGSDGLGVADFGLSKRYVIPPLFDYSTTGDGPAGDTVLGKAAGGEIRGPGTGTSDDVPMMGSDGEFMMTADAVRGAGGGSRREGARRMYQIMHDFERRTGRGG